MPFEIAYNDLRQSTEFPQDGGDGQAFIFAIGIDCYEQCPVLQNAVSDTKKLIQVLTNRYQFEPSNVIKLLDGDATRSNIYANFRKLAQKLTEKDSLFIYYAGHGSYDKVFDKGYWIPVDGRPGDPTSYYSGDEIINAVKHIKTLHTVIVSDSCFSGTLFTRSAEIFFPEVEEEKETLEERLIQTPSRWLMTSGRNEVVPDDGPFAKMIFKYLANNEKPLLRLSQMYHDIQVGITRNSWQTPRFQPLYGVGDEGGEFVLRLKPKGGKKPDDYSKVEPNGQGLKKWDEVVLDHNLSDNRKLLPRSLMVAIGVFLTALIGFFIANTYLKKGPTSGTEAPKVAIVLAMKDFIDLGVVTSGIKDTFEISIKNNSGHPAYINPPYSSNTAIRLLGSWQDSIPGSRQLTYKMEWDVREPIGRQIHNIDINGKNLEKTVNIKVAATIEAPSAVASSNSKKPAIIDVGPKKPIPKPEEETGTTNIETVDPTPTKPDLCPVNIDGWREGLVVYYWVKGKKRKLENKREVEDLQIPCDLQYNDVPFKFEYKGKSDSRNFKPSKGVFVPETIFDD